MSERELPPGWAWATVEDTCKFGPKHDRSVPPSTLVSFVPMAAVDDITGAILSPTDRPLSEINKGYTHFADGDVIWAKITPCMENGKSALCEGLTNGLGCGSTEFIVLRSHGAVLPSYLHRFVRQVSYRKSARLTMQSGVGQARVPGEFVLSTELPVPPLNEQKRIVAKLEAVQARAEGAKAALDAVGGLLEKFRQSVLAAAFRGDLTREWRAQNPNTEPASALLARIRAERRRRWQAANPKKQYVEPEPVDTSNLPELPEGWCWASVEELTPAEAPPVYGIIQPGPHVPDGVPFIRPLDISAGTVDIENLPRTSQEISEKYRRAALEPGDLVFSIVGTIGKWVIVPENLAGANITQSSVRIRPLRPFDALFVLRALQSPVLAEQMGRMIFGNAVQRLNIQHVRDLAIPIPPWNEWIAIDHLLREALDGCVKLLKGASGMESTLKQLTQATLAKAFRGELVPQDPEDEPASALLARIAATRSTEAPKRRGRKPKL